MKEIKVYLQYPWKFPDSPYYKYLIEKPPKGINYFNIKKQKKLITSKGKFNFLIHLKGVLRLVLDTLKIPISNARLTKSREKYDLIHCAHCLSKNKSPWIADIESLWQFWIAGEGSELSKKIVRKFLLDKNCKKILAWTENTKKEILEVFPEIKAKVEVVSPAVPPQKSLKKKKKTTIIYVSRYFWVKGGLIALETMRKLKAKYNVETVFIADVPEKIKKEYSDINIVGLVPQKELFQYYSKSDIFLYPCLGETFGFALLEAMSFGLPIVTVNTNRTKTRKEIVQDGKTGFIIDMKEKLTSRNYQKINIERKGYLADNLVDKASKLINNKKLLEKMSKNCLDIIKKGKFSIKERDKKLKKIYQEALES